MTVRVFFICCLFLPLKLNVGDETCGYRGHSERAGVPTNHRELFVIKHVFGKGRRKNRVMNIVLVCFQNDL